MSLQRRGFLYLNAGMYAIIWLISWRLGNNDDDYIYIRKTRNAWGTVVTSTTLPLDHREASFVLRFAATLCEICEFSYCVVSKWHIYPILFSNYMYSVPATNGAISTGFGGSFVFEPCKVYTIFQPYHPLYRSSGPKTCPNSSTS